MEAKTTNIRISNRAYMELKKIKDKTGIPIKTLVNIMLGLERKERK